MNSSMFLAILLMAAVTFLTRWLPFAAFRPGQPIPKTIAYLGQVLPFAMMAMLVVYGLRSTDWLGSNHGLPELLERVAVDALYLPEIEDEYGVRDKLVALAAEKNIRVSFVTEQTEISLGAATVTVFPPVGKGDMNEQGLTYLCTSGDFDLLITGDMSGPTELALTQMYKLPDVEVLLVGHHGSKYSSQQEFLSKIEPDAAIISVGDNNYGHPTDAAISRLEAAGATVYRTDRQGCVTVTLRKQ